MTTTVKNIIPAKNAESVQTTQYTAVNCKTTIDKFTAGNTSAANLVFSVNLPKLGDSASASNRIIILRGIAPGETYTCPELIGQVIESGGFISTLASATGLTISAAGREIV